MALPNMGMARPLQAVSEPQLSEDKKSIVQIATQTITITKAQLLQRKEQLTKAIVDIDVQLALFPAEEVK